MAMTTQPTFTWTTSVAEARSQRRPVHGARTTASGTVTATSGAVSGNSTVTVTDHAPTVATAAAATPGAVNGTTTVLTALGADVDTGAASLTYTWTATALPDGASPPTFSVNGSNAAQNTTATFSAAGSYTFQVTIADPGGLTATSSVNVTVNQTLTTIAVSPSSADPRCGRHAAVRGNRLRPVRHGHDDPAEFTWTTSVAGGTIDPNGGLFDHAENDGQRHSHGDQRFSQRGNKPRST